MAKSPPLIGDWGRFLKPLGRRIRGKPLITVRADMPECLWVGEGVGCWGGGVLEEFLLLANLTVELWR